MCMCGLVGACGCQKKFLDFQELETQVVMSDLA